MLPSNPLPHLILPPNPAAFALVRAIAGALPPPLVTLWQQCGKGTILITNHLSTGYLPTLMLMSGYSINYPLCVPSAGSEAELWAVVGAWLNHFGGSRADGDCLTDGKGATPTLQSAAARLQLILARGYANDHLQADDPAALFARAVAAYHLAPRDLSFADPQLYKWLKYTLFDEAFWRKVSGEVIPPV